MRRNFRSAPLKIDSGRASEATASTVAAVLLGRFVRLTARLRGADTR